MKLKFNKSDAIRSMQPLQGILSSKSMLPILSCVILEAKGGNAKVIGSDLELWLSSPFPAEVEGEGSVSIPGRRFFNIVRELPADIATLETGSDNETRITSARSFFRMKGVSKDEFPSPPDLGDGPAVRISQQVLKELVKKTSYAISLDETRYVLNGMYLIFEGGRVTAVATDGRRLALARADCKMQSDLKKDLILPNKAVQELGRLLDIEGEGQIKLGDRQIAFDFPEVLMVSRLIDGRFPNYQQVIPKEEGVRIKLNRVEFLNVVKRASLITDEKSNSVKFSFSPGTLTITAVTPEVGEAREEMNIDQEGTSMEIAFNPHYIMDVLKAVDEEEEVIIELLDSNSPGIIKTDDSFLCVIMPMQLS